MLAITGACLPLYVLRWRVGPLPTTLLEVLILLTIAIYALSLRTERRLPRARTPYDIPILLLLAAGVLGVVVAPDHLRGVGIYRAYFLEAIAMFYIAVDLIRGREDLQVVLLAAAAGSSLMALGQIASFAFVAAHDNLQLGDAPAFLNTTPNADAMYLEPPLAFATAFVLFPSRPRERQVAAVVLVLVLAAIITTLSRASYLSMTVLAAVIVLGAQTWKWRLRAIAALMALGLIVLEIPYVNHRFLDLARSVTNRESLYTQAISMLAQRPLLGAGFDGFPVRVAPFRPPSQTVHLYPHNLWLTTWSEIGLLGVAAFALIFFGLLVRGALALPRATDVYRPLLWGAVGALVLYTVHGLFDSPYWKNDLSVEFWLLAALEVVAVRSTVARAPDQPPRAIPSPR
jgi:O-antigen ligase